MEERHVKRCGQFHAAGRRCRRRYGHACRMDGRTGAKYGVATGAKPSAETPNAQQGANLAGNNNSWKSRYYENYGKSYLYTKEFPRGYEIPAKSELQFSDGNVSLQSRIAVLTVWIKEKASQAKENQSVNPFPYVPVPSERSEQLPPF